MPLTDTKPELRYFTGPSGAGKSSLVVESALPDHFSLDEARKEANGGSAQNFTNRASEIALNAEAQFWTDHLQNPRSFSTERPLKYAESLSLLTQAKTQGYSVNVVFVSAGSVENHIERVKARVLDGEHALERSEIVAIHSRSMENLRQLFELSADGTIDQLTIFDNEGTSAEKVFQAIDGRIVALKNTPDWFHEALQSSPFQVDHLKTAEANGLSLRDLDIAAPLREEALREELFYLSAWQDDPNLSTFEEEGIREHLAEARSRLIRGTDANTVVNQLARSIGGNSYREYADTVVTRVEQAIPTQLEKIPLLEAGFDPTLLKDTRPPLTPPLVLGTIRLNEYPQPDRAEVQLRVSQEVTADPERFLDAYKADPRSLNGRYICSDLFKETFPDFSASNEARARYNNPLHNSAAVLSAAQLTRAIQANDAPERETVILLTGVPGAGKTTAVLTGGELASDVRAVYEGQLAKPDAAIVKVQEILDAGLTPSIVVVHTSPETALQNTLSRFEREGRGASLHAMASIQSELPDGLRAIQNAFGDSVSFAVFDRSGDLNDTQQREGWDQLSTIEKEGNYDHIRERLSNALEQHHAAGTISEDGYRQAKGLPTREAAERTNAPDGRGAESVPAGLSASAAVERHGALRFWQETTTDHTIKYAAGRLNKPGVDSFPRDLAAQRAVSRGMGDHAGHLIGHQFGGPEIPGNLSLQHYGQNQGGGTYYNLESMWAEKLKQGSAISVNVREMTKTGEDRPYHRHVTWVETEPSGKTHTEARDFAMTESTRALAARGVVIPPQQGTTVELYPDGPPPPADIAVQLTPAQVRSLIQAEMPDDLDKQRQAYSAVFHGSEDVRVLEDRAELGYSQDATEFFAIIQPDQKPALDERLSQLSKEPPARTRDFDRDR